MPNVKLFQISEVMIIMILALFLPAIASETGFDIKERWGVEVEDVRLSAAGYMLDFRYKVINPDKAAPLQDMKFKPYLIDEASGAKLIVPSPPKVGALRQRVKSGKPIPGRTYFIIFSNPGRFVGHGNKVTIVIGDFKAENLVVK